MCFSEARNSFNRAYSKANFYVAGPFTGGLYEYKKQSVRIKNFHTTRNILQTFGDLIQLIDISFDDINETEGSEIVRYISENGTNSLTQLNLRNCYAAVLNELKKPFSHVKSSIISTNLTSKLSKSGDKLNLSELFPKLKRFDLKICNANDWDFVGDGFPYLKSLTVEFPEVMEFDRIDFERFFKTSPNINSLSISNSSLMILKAASDFLPNLKCLKIFNFSTDNYEGDEIQFKNVSSLHMTSTHDNERIPQNLIFTQLQTLTLRLEYDFTNQWNEFFGNESSKSIEFFDIQANSFTKTQLMVIAENQPNIKWAFVQSKTELSAEAIVCFIEKSKRLFSLSYTSLTDISQQQLLKEKLQNEWSINPTLLIR